jgi:hypothetical protein
MVEPVNSCVGQADALRDTTSNNTASLESGPEWQRLAGDSEPRHKHKYLLVGGGASGEFRFGVLLVLKMSKEQLSLRLFFGRTRLFFG